ncbi:MULTISPECIES: hypothetical protein [Bacillaceae]|uniref:Uncharacterized protein n=1 Tax=Evansella alkalicola TaxID=745819 RepID=A0ABS6JNZ7_9BACI|nr:MULTISPECIES: hypothetical protein [Bacillaceae]MBU9720160.1 hypothetical protein [Bacillus alkalicola]
MNKEKLTSFFENMSPTESQKKRMKKAILSHGDGKSSRSKSPNWWANKGAKVVASVILAVVIIGTLPLAGKAGAGIVNWFQNQYDSIIGAVENQEDLLIDGEFSVEKHEKLTERHEYRGLSKERAEEQAFVDQSYEVAIIHRAMDLGIDVTREEALQRAYDSLEGWAEMDEEEAAAMDIESLNPIQSEIEDLRLNEDEFWVEQRLHSFAFNVLLFKVMEHEMNENPSKGWNEIHMEIVSDFIVNEAEKLAEFRKKVGLD